MLRTLPYGRGADVLQRRLAEQAGTLILDSGRGCHGARYDYLLGSPVQTQRLDTTNRNDFMNRLRTANWPAATICCAGILGYEGSAAIAGLPACAIDDTQTGAWAGWYDWAVVTDHLTRQSWVSIARDASPERSAQVLARCDGPPEDDRVPFRLTAPFRADAPPDWYAEAFERIRRHIVDGDCYQVNLTMRYSAPCEGSAFQAWQAIRARCPVGMAAWLQLEQEAILCHSPETFLRLRDGHVVTEPIKGTRPRDQDPALDHALATALQNSAKDRAENLMIVDLLRNDLGRTCAYGSIRVPALNQLQSNPSVHHLVSRVSGTLAQDRDATDLLLACIPGGSVTGAPKHKAMEIIAELEPHRREAYCGSFFRIDRAGNLDSNIAIRSFSVRDGRIRAWGGGGIVADSVCEEERAEAWCKLARMAQVLESMGSA